MVIFSLTKEFVYQLSPVGHRLSPSDNLLLVGLAIPLLILVAELNYRFVETPFRNLGIRLAAKSKDPKAKAFVETVA
ncbi:hypothetical protein D3C87_1886840 [compost metagenome]